jgi:glycosyltransferase involved in cell wall biosynthesis
MPFWSVEQKKKLREMSGLIDVFISPDTVKEWGWTEENSRVILHGMDSELFRPKEIKNKQPHILSIANDFANRDLLLGFSTWKEVVKDLPIKLYGETEGLSRPAKDVSELISFYQEATCFLSTTILSPLPSVVLESMCCGLPVISTDNNLLSTVIDHGVNGFLSNSPKELRKYCKLLLNDRQLAEKMGKAARQTIIEKFSLKKFVDSWNEVFLEAANTPFRG